MAHTYAETPLKTVRSQDGKIYYIIQGNGNAGFAQVRYVDFYSTLYQIPNVERSENVLYFVEHAAVHQGGDNDGDPSVKYGWGVYLWHVPKQRYYLIAQQSGEDYVVKSDLEKYLLKSVFANFLKQYTTTISNINNINGDQTYWINWLRSRLTDVGNSLHAHQNMTTLDKLSDSNGLLYFDGKIIGGNSYVYDVRDENDKIYWQNPCNPSEVDMTVRTVQGIVEKFLTCDMCRIGMTLYIVDDVNNIAAYKIGTDQRIQHSISVYDYTFEGGAQHNQSKIYYLYEDGFHYRLYTRDANDELRDSLGNLVDDKYDLDLYKKIINQYRYENLNYEPGTICPISWTFPSGDIVLKLNDGTYTTILNKEDLREQEIIASTEDDPDNEYWTAKAADLYQRINLGSKTMMKPTLGRNDNEELDDYGEYFNPGTEIYSGVERQVRADILRFKAIYDQTIANNDYATYGVTTRCDTLPPPEQRYYQQGVWSPLTNTQEYPAEHLYKCLPVESSLTESGYAEYYWYDCTAALNAPLTGVVGARCITAFCVDETMWKKYGILYFDPEEFVYHNGQHHKFGKTVLVRKFGSAPQHVGDGVVVWSSDVRVPARIKDAKLIWDTVPASREQVFYRLFTFSTFGAPYDPDDAIEPQPYDWDDIKALGVPTGLLKKIYSVGDTIYLPEHSVYGHIPTRIMAFQEGATVDGVTKDYMLVATTDVLPRKEFNPKEYELSPLQLGDLPVGAICYQITEVEGRTIYIPVEFTGAMDVTGLYKKVGVMEGTTTFAYSTLHDWLNSTAVEWYTPKHEETPSYVDEIGFLAGFSAEDRSIFKKVDNNSDDLVSIPNEHMDLTTLFTPAKVLRNTKVETPWWASDTEDESGVTKVAYYNGSAKDHTLPSGTNFVPGVVAVFRLG